VSKEYRRTSGTDSEKTPLLMMSQFWLWRFDQVLLSAYSMSFELPQAMFFSTIPDANATSPVESSYYKIGCGIELDHEGARYKSPLHMFETAIVSTLADVQCYLTEAPQTYAIKDQKKKEVEFIHCMSDIHNELDMIQSVIEQQMKVFDAFPETTKHVRSNDRSQKSLDEYEKRVQKIHRDADRVEKTIESYPSLKRTYASIEDTRNGLMLGFSASAFAFIIVIFTSLSFMTSLFALPIDHFMRQQTNDAISAERVFKSSYIGGYTGMFDLPKLAQ
jgi:hypothetical protein